MAYEIPTELINQIQISTREQAGLSGYDPARTSHFPVIPSLSGNVAALDPSPPDLRCKNCKGKLLRGPESLLCIYCGRLNDAVSSPQPIFFKDTIGYSWLLHSLNLDGSEMVEPHAEKNETTRGQGVPKDKMSLSELLNFQISWRAESKKVENDVTHTEVEQSNSFSQWNGIELDDFFLESNREKRSSMAGQPVVSTQVQLEGTKPVTTHENPNFFQHASRAAPAVASTAVKDHEISGWQAEFQPADTGAQSTSQLYGTSAAPPVDLSTHMDSVFGFGNDSKNEDSTPVDWTPDDLRNNTSSEAFSQSVHFDLNQRDNNSQMQNKRENSSTSGDWFQADEWGINNPDQPQKVITTDDDDSFAEWNDFTSSSNVPDPSGSAFVESGIPGAISHEKSSSLDLFSFDEKHNDMDVSGFGRANIFSDSFSKNDDVVEADNLTAGVSSSDRLGDWTSVVEDAAEHGAVNVEHTNANTNTVEDVQGLISEMHDLSFMLQDDLTIPSKPTDSHNLSF